jgi:hypothetical protein
LGDLRGAHSCAERALAIREKVLGPDHPDTAGGLNNLAALLSSLGALAGARPHYERALAIQEKVLGTQHPDTANTLNNLGFLLQELGDLAGARPCFERSLAIREKALGPDHLDTARSLDNLSALCVALGQEETALDLMQRAAAIDDGVIGQVFSVGSDRQRMAFLRTIPAKIGRFLSLVSQYFAGSVGPAGAALDLVLRRKGIVAEALATQRDAVLRGKYPTLAKPLREWARLRMQLAHKTLAGAGPEGPLAHGRQLAQWAAVKERLETDLARQIPEMNLQQKLQKADRRAVAEALNEGACLVEFVHFPVCDFKAVPARGGVWWHPSHYLAFVLHARQPDRVRMIDLGEAGAIDRLIAEFRAVITAEEADEDGQPAEPENAPEDGPGHRLRALVFDPLLPALGGRTRLLLAPDGDLARLPFEVLPAADERRLIDGYQMSYLGCGRDALRFGARPGASPGPPLVVADPAFNLTAAGAVAAARAAVTGRAEEGAASRSPDLARGMRFYSLEDTREEGERVAGMLGIKPWLGPDALEGRVKQARSPRVLHLATHGFFLPDQAHDPSTDAEGATLSAAAGRLRGPGMANPLLRSGLVLAGANVWLWGGPVPPEAEDGLLTAEDVSGMDLLDTELVVLSACDTGLGEIHVGEGVFGLQRAFLLAGARTVVMSLWKVPDEQTRELMTDFYARVLANGEVAQALREAQAALKEKYPAPYIWGAFICQGDPCPVVVASA